MRNTSETGAQGLGTNEGEKRMTVVTPAALVNEFREIAKQRDQTLSQEVRRLMREYIAQDREAA